MRRGHSQHASSNSSCTLGRTFVGSSWWTRPIRLSVPGRAIRDPHSPNAKEMNGPMYVHLSWRAVGVWMMGPSTLRAKPTRRRHGPHGSRFRDRVAARPWTSESEPACLLGGPWKPGTTWVYRRLESAAHWALAVALGRPNEDTGFRTAAFSPPYSNRVRWVVALMLNLR